MTILDAIRGEIAPFTANKITIEKACIDNNVNSTGVYSVSEKTVVATISIAILQSFMALSSESEGGFSQSYDKAGLLSKIAALAKSNGVEVEGNSISDGSNRW